MWVQLPPLPLDTPSNLEYHTAMQINRNAIPDSGSVTILSHTYTWLRHKDSPSRFTLTKDNFGDWDTDLDTQVELPEVFNFVDLNEETCIPSARIAVEGTSLSMTPTTSTSLSGSSTGSRKTFRQT